MSLLGEWKCDCLYAFTDPRYPSFTLPSAQPTSPGDIQLNPDNPIRFANGSSIAHGQGCNSGTFAYATDDDDANPFSSTYEDCEGRISDIGNLIYATKQDQLFVRTIQSNQANLGQ